MCQLPTPEEMFSILASGESYSKLDLAWALQADKGSRKLSAIANNEHYYGTIAKL